MMKKVTYFHPRQGLRVVKRGFSWPAFFFGSLWAAVNRLWMPVFILMVLFETLLWLVGGVAAAQRMQGLAWSAAGLSLAYACLRGLLGNRWIENSLPRRGYRPHGDDPEPIWREPTF